jgi:hypothetical protein
MFALAALTLFCFVSNTQSIDYATAPPTFEASQYTNWQHSTYDLKGSRRANLNVPFTNDVGESDSVHLVRVDLVGEDSYDRGFAHGFLLAKEIAEFSGPALDKFYMDMILELQKDLYIFPEPLQKILTLLDIKLAKEAPGIFKKALDWVWSVEEQYQPQYLKSEIDGIANGMCASPLFSKNCNVEEWSAKLKQTNMLPELIRMACTAFGAWGKATPNGGLVQLRALDFGSGPFANYTILQVHRLQENSFVSVSFPGMVGVVTGVSQSGIGVSEKVWETYQGTGMQPGSYDGEADIFVLRDILQQSKNRVEAEAYLKQANRTWAIWVGIGDYETQTFDLVGYKEASLEVWTDVTAPAQTGQPYLESIAYVDKHPQPSGEGPTGTLPSALTDFYGQITQETTKIITQYHKTGDLHIASYDFTTAVMYLSLGRVNHEGNYGPSDGTDMNVWKAYNRPYLKFNLADFWEGV